jgi:hypothetical protein
MYKSMTQMMIFGQEDEPEADDFAEKVAMALHRSSTYSPTVESHR